jgi:hypothetical protein
MAIELNPAHPGHYTVAEGDTLWSIAARFLNRPWEWPELWRGNSRIKNPDIIYPGDVIALDQSGGKPYLRLDSPPESRLRPRVRATPLESAIPVIPLRVIQPFLTHPRVVDEGVLERQPYVVDLAEEHVVGSPGGLAYVRSIQKFSPADYIVYRPGAVYRDGEGGETLGQEAIFIAVATLQQPGDPATVMLNRSEKEVRPGDRLMPAGSEAIGSGYTPHPPKGAWPDASSASWTASRRSASFRW